MSLGRPEFAGKPADGIGPERIDGNDERFAAATGRALEGEFVITGRALRIPAHAHRMPALAARGPLEDGAFHKRIKRTTLPQHMRNVAPTAAPISVADIHAELTKLVSYHYTTTGRNAWLSAFHRGLLGDLPAQAFVAAKAMTLTKLAL